MSLRTSAQPAQGSLSSPEGSQIADRAGANGNANQIEDDNGCFHMDESIQDVISQRNAEGIDSLLFFERIGSKAYYRKGGR